MSDPQTVSAARLDVRNRRAAPRFDTLDRILGRLLSTDMPVRIREVGFGGFSAESEEPVHAGGVHAVRFAADDNWTTILTARSVHCRPAFASDGSARYITGFEFLHLVPQDTEDAVKRIVDRIAAPRSVAI